MPVTPTNCHAGQTPPSDKSSVADAGYPQELRHAGQAAAIVKGTVTRQTASVVKTVRGGRWEKTPARDLHKTK